MSKTFKIVGDDLSDGFHTFDELYEHRIALWITFCRLTDDFYPWRSQLHSDGSKIDGWFILGIGRSPGEQITYHLPMSRWGDTEFADTLDRAPEWDGHTPADVLSRLMNL